MFDDYCENPLPFLVYVDRTGISNRRTRPHRMNQYVEPARFVGLHSAPVPFLIGDDVIGIFESALLELDISDHHLILVDAPLDRAVDARDFHHLQSQITELMRCKKCSVRPTERNPRYVLLRLQLRQKDELAFVCLAGLKDVLNK